MKNYIFVLFVAIAFCFCNKNVAIINPIDTNPIPIDTIASIIDFGKSSLLKNGIKWDLDLKAKFYDSSKKQFFLRSEIVGSTDLKGSFGILHIDCNKGMYPIEYFKNYNFTNSIPEGRISYLYEGDQPAGSFYTDSTRFNHFIEVLKYDSINQIIEGTFQMYLGKEINGIPFPGIPDSIFITEGRFNLKIEEQ
jgi:hypothetical protein